MLRKAILCIFSLTAFAGLICAQDFGAKQIDPEKAALIEEMMTLTRPDRLLPLLLEQYKRTFYEGFELSLQSQLRRQHEYPAKYQPYILHLENDVFTMLTKRLTWDKVKPSFIAVYDETFSKQELREFVTFFNTPSGQSVNRKMPALTVKCLQVAQGQWAIQRMNSRHLLQSSSAMSKIFTRAPAKSRRPAMNSIVYI